MVLLIEMARKVEFDKDLALHKAMKLFWLKGYDATSMQDLVDAMQINRFSIYNSFGDKKTLYIKVLAYYRRTVLAYLLRPLKTQAPAKKRLDDYLLLMSEQLQSKSGGLGCMIQNTGLSPVSTDSEVAEMLAFLFNDLRTALLSVVEAAAENRAEEESKVLSGSASEYNPIVLTGFILSQIQGLIILRKAQQDAEGIDAQITLLRVVVGRWWSDTCF